MGLLYIAEQGGGVCGVWLGQGDRFGDLQGQSDPVGEQSSCHNLGGDMVDIFSTHLQHPHMDLRKALQFFL